MDLELQSALVELDDGDCYDNDAFEDADALTSSPVKQQQIAVARDGQVHPLHPTDAALKLGFTPVVASSDESTSAENEGDDDDDSGRYSDDDEFDRGKLSPTLSLAHKQEHVSDVEHTHQSVAVDESLAAPATAHAQPSESIAIDLVSIHAHRRNDRAVSPPPAPARAPGSHQLELDRTMERMRLSAQRALVAVKRVTEYREGQARREMQEQADASALKKKREQFRASNRKHYDTMGVYRLTGEQRFGELVKETALLKQHERACAELERRQRWYNQRAAARASNTSGTAAGARGGYAPAHVAHLQTRHIKECEQRYSETVGRAQRIQTQQAELHTRASALVSKCTRNEYVRGSYLFKHERGTSKSQVLARATTEHASTSVLLASSTSVELEQQEQRGA